MSLDIPPISCIIVAVNNALNGCAPPRATATPTPVAPQLSLGVQVSSFPEQHQVAVVAVLIHLGGSVVSYQYRCPGECGRPFITAISFALSGPDGAVILENPCEAETLCPIGLEQLRPGESLHQALAITGTAWDQDPTFPGACDGCRQTQLAPGHYIVAARFLYGIGSSFDAPITQELSETASFDWPPTGSPPETPPTPREPTTTPYPTPVLDCSGVPDYRPCIGPCAPCNPSVSGYCRSGECVTECAPCVTETPTPVTDCRGAPAYAPCVAGCGTGVCYGALCSASECTPSVTATATPRVTPTPTPSPLGRMRTGFDTRRGRGEETTPPGAQE
jgi:hypothetical protein